MNPPAVASPRGTPQVNVNSLASLLDRRTLADHDYRVHVVAHQWALATALSINSREDFESLPKLNVEPFEHQINAAITYFRRLAPSGLIADDVGLGKTITAGLILAELLKRRKVKSFLVVCPKIIMHQWSEELKAKFGIEAYPLIGQDFKYNVNKNSLITTYDTARNYMDKIKARGFDCIILDEAHKVRNLCGVDNPAKRSVKLREALDAKAFRYVLELTATPLQTSLWDVYSLVELLKTPGAHPLGPEADFENRYLGRYPDSRKYNPRSIRPEMREEFRRRLSEVMIRTRRQDTKLNFPTREVRMDRLKATDDEKTFIDRAITAAVDVNPLERMSLIRGALSSPPAAANEIENKIEKERFVGQDVLPWQSLADTGRAIKTSVKLERVLRLIEELRSQRPADWRVVVFTGRRETLNFIREALHERGLGSQVGFIQGSAGNSNQRVIADFMVDPPRIHAIVSTDAGAEGVNLQACNVLVNYDLPWNPMVIEQRIGRIQRLGQKAKHVIVYNLVVKDTVEDEVVVRLMERLKLFETAIGEMEAILSQVGEGEDEDQTGESFEQKILRLVMKSLEKRSIEADLEAERRSVEAARKRLEEAHHDIEASLGRVDPDSSGPIMPQLVPRKPDMALREFVLNALTSSGGKSEVEPDGITYRFSHQARGEFGLRVTFTPDHPIFEMGRLGASTITLYAEGERSFEHLVHEWMGKAQAILHDARCRDEVEVKRLCRAILERKGLHLEEDDLVVTNRSVEVLPEITWKANISVFHDQYDKIVSQKVARPEHGLTTWPGQQDGPLDVKVMDSATAFAAVSRQSGRIAEEVTTLAQTDPDISGFSGFYEGRLREEIQRHERFWAEKANVGERNAQIAQARKDDLYRQLKPELKLDPIGLKGLVYEVVTVHAHRHMGARDIRVPIEIVPISEKVLTPWVSAAGGKELAQPAFCVGGHLVNSTELVHCTEEGCSVEACGKCGAHALPLCPACRLPYCSDHAVACIVCKRSFCARHKVVTADEAVACVECTGVCQETGARLPLTSLDHCSLSKALVRKDLLARSVVSGKLALPRLMEKCEETGQPALPGELVVCAVTQKKVLPSAVAECPDTQKRALKRLFEPCGESNVKVLPEALAACEETGRRVRRVLLEKCEVSGKTVLRRLLKESTVSKKRALASYGNASAVSGQWALKDEMLPCEVTGAFAIPEELDFCSVTGKRVLPKLTGKCTVTGKIALLDQLDRSVISGRRVLKSLLKPCAVTGRLALENELVRCDESGKSVLPTLLEKCAFTGKQVLSEHMGESQVSGKRVLKRMLVPCAVTGRLALESELVRCDESGKSVLPTLIEKCSFTGTQALSEYMGESEFSRKRALKRVLVPCAVSGRLALPSELEMCEVSKKHVTPEFLNQCDISGKHVLPEYLLKSQLSGRQALKELSFHCPACEKVCLEDECKHCPKCSLKLCNKCVPGSLCDGCQLLMNDATELIPTEKAPRELTSLWPKAARWKTARLGRLLYGVGLPSILNLLTPQKLIVLEQRSGAESKVACNKALYTGPAKLGRIFGSGS